MPEPFENAVDDVEKPCAAKSFWFLSNVLILILKHILSASGKCELSYCLLNCEIFHAGDNELWHSQDESKTSKFHNDVLRFLLIKRLKNVADFCQEKACGLHEAEEESSCRLVELVWATESIFHHVDSISGIRETHPVEDEDSEEQANIDWSAHFVAKVKFFEFKVFKINFIKR